MELLQKYFDTALDSKDGIKKLREMILTLAMKGKLVPQDPADQPASKLIKEVQAEKAKLIKDGKIKKQKDLPPIKPEEIPYQLPNGWEWVRLGNLGNIFNGNSINDSEKKSKFTKATGTPYIATKDIGYGFDELDYNNGISIPIGSSKFKIARAGSVLICSEGGSAGKKCGITNQDICFGNKLYALEPFSIILSKYILYIYLSPFFKQLFIENMTGIIGGIPQSKFLNILIPLPPFQEQLKVIEKIDLLMTKCDVLEKLKKEMEQKRLDVHKSAVHALLNSGEINDSWQFLKYNFSELYTVKENVAELRKVILQLAMMGKLVPQDPADHPASELLREIQAEKAKLIKEGKIKKQKDLLPLKLNEFPYELPSNWNWIQLQSILVFGPTNGFSPASVNFETDVKSLTLTATTSGSFNPNHTKNISNEIPLDSHLWLESGDILVQRGNTIEYVGVSAVYYGDSYKYIYPDLMMKIRVSDKLSVSYIHYAMNSSTCRSYLRSKASGTSGTMPKINQLVLLSLPIPLPPLAEQKLIVAKIDSLMAMCDELEKQITDSENKKSALLNSLTAQV